MQAPTYHRTWIFSSKGSCLGAIRSIVEEAAVECGLTQQEIYGIKVAVSEACSNAIEHGSPQGGEDTFQVEITCDRDEFIIRVKDNGIFKRRKASERGHLSSRGRGHYLMMALMDSVSVQESPSGTTVIMSRKVHS